jgi:acetyl esterase
MPLDPQAKAILDAMNAAPPLDTKTLEPAVMRVFFESMKLPSEPVVVAAVEDRRLPGPACEIPVRIYTPEGRAPFPVLAYFHGGGFVIGSLDSHDGVCRELCQESGCLVVSVDYRLAPEHPFPAAPEDCYAATCWLAEHGAQIGADPTRIAVGGDSAGGNLAAVVALMARERGGPSLRHQLLVYPVTDHSFETPSYRDNAEGYMLTQDMMRWFWGHYLTDAAQGRDPLASPLRAKSLAGLPPATVITAEFDPLRDEGEAFAERLMAAGVRTQLTRYDGVFHGFFSMANVIDRGRRAVEQAARALRQAFA